MIDFKNFYAYKISEHSDAKRYHKHTFFNQLY